MKKIILLLAAVATFAVAQAQHIEFKWRGYYVVAGYDFATNLNTTEYNDRAVFHGFSAVGGFQFRKESGLGIGCSYMLDPTGAFSQLPVFVELRSHYMRSRVSPFSSLYVGYSIPLGSSSTGDNAITISKGGVVSGISVGARYAISRHLAVNAFVGYQELYMGKVDRKTGGLLSDSEPLLFHNLKFGVGVNF